MKYRAEIRDNLTGLIIKKCKWMSTWDAAWGIGNLSAWSKIRYKVEVVNEKGDEVAPLNMKQV